MSGAPTSTHLHWITGEKSIIKGFSKTMENNLLGIGPLSITDYKVRYNWIAYLKKKPVKAKVMVSKGGAILMTNTVLHIISK